jgi:hypothetical protein
MRRRLRAFIHWLVVALATSPGAAYSQSAQFGSAAEAKKMLERAISELALDEKVAIAKFNSGENGFKDRDLFLFCFSIAGGKITANQPDVTRVRLAEVQNRLSSLPPISDPKVAKAATTWSVAAAEHYLSSIEVSYNQSKNANLPVWAIRDVLQSYRDALTAAMLARLRAASEHFSSLLEMGSDVRTLKDVVNRQFGQDLYKAAQDNHTNEVVYTVPQPTVPEERVQRGIYVTKVGSSGCGVGYYK